MRSKNQLNELHVLCFNFKQFLVFNTCENFGKHQELFVSWYRIGACQTRNISIIYFEQVENIFCEQKTPYAYLLCNVICFECELLLFESQASSIDSSMISERSPKSDIELYFGRKECHFYYRTARIGQQFFSPFKIFIICLLSEEKLFHSLLRMNREWTIYCNVMNHNSTH